MISTTKRASDKLTTIVLLLCAIISTVSNCLAQDYNGIKFESGLSFVQIKEKAKAEKKYIFVDVYTTWCIPCKKMEADIFPVKVVGDFFNSNFINYKVQIDSTKDDSYLIKNAYNDAKLIKDTYQIKSYPTYLVLNPDGVLLHKFGGSSSAEKFIANAKNALNPVTQGIYLVKEFQSGRRDSSFLKSMIQYGTSSDSKNRALYVQCFLKTQEDLLTKQNILYILQSIATSKDVGYDILVNHPKEVIAVAGERWRNDVINDIIFVEHILPLLRKDGRKEILSGGMYIYIGDIIKNVDWPALQQILDAKHRERSARLMIEARTTYYQWTEDWGNLNSVLLEYSLSNNNVEEDVLANWLQYFTSFGKNEYLADALRWSSKISSSKNPIVIQNRALIFYKLGRKQKAIKTMLKYQDMLPKPNLETSKLITKMKKGEKID